MTRNLRWLVLGLVLSMGMWVPAVMAQTVNQSITGQVTDPSGAVVSGAVVTAHAVETGVDTKTTTNDSIDSRPLFGFRFCAFLAAAVFGEEGWSGSGPVRLGLGLFIAILYVLVVLDIP